MKKCVALILCTSMLLTAVTGCGKKEEAPTIGSQQAESTAAVAQESSGAAEETVQKPYGILKTYSTTEITTINPFENADSDATDFISGTLIKPYVTVPSGDGESYYYKPELAAEEPTPLNEEHTEWTFPVRENLYWEDGKQITAHDLVYSAKMCLDPKLLTRRGPSLASNYVTIANAEAYTNQESTGVAVAWEEVGIQALDDFTIKVTCEEYATARDLMQHFSNKWNVVVREDLFESCMSEDKTSNTYGTSLDTWMSCGRYILTDMQPGVSFTMMRNDNYVFPDDIKLEGYQMKIVKDSNTALELFLNGELDHVSLSASAKEQYEDDPRIWISPASTVQTMSINRANTNQNGLLGNVNFRRALFYAVDRETVASLVKGIPANYILGMKVLGNLETGELYRDLPGSKAILSDNYSYDPDLAKDYYAKALEELGLKEASIELLYSDSSANYKMVAEYLQKALPEVLGDSFSVKLNPQAANTAKAQRKGWAKGDVNCSEIAFTSWDTSSVAPWNAMKVYCTWYGGRNEPIFDEEYDALWEEANNSREAKNDLDYRIELVNKMEQRALEDVFVVPMYEVPSYQLINDRIVLPFEHYAYGYGYGWLYASIVE